MTSNAGTVEVTVKPKLDTTEFATELATLERIAVWRTSVVPNWITAVSAVGLLVHALVG